MKHKNFFHMKFLLYALIIISLCFSVGCHRTKTESKQYKSITKVVFTLQNPPFTEYTLTTAEMNDFIKALSKINLTPNNKLDAQADGLYVKCTIFTVDDQYLITLIPPYIGYQGEQYKFARNPKVFKITERIVNQMETSE